MTISATRDDTVYMDRALELARGQLGKVAPNPAVGCVIVRDGEIVGEGATAEGGRPHAEEIALEAAGNRARGAVAYVSLEPCAVRSSGDDSCSDLFVAAGVKRVVVACDDPHPFADGDGLARLRAAGVEVKVGVGRREGEAINAGFFLVVREGRPFVAIDDDNEAYDAKLALDPDTELLEQLRALANQGFTRVNAEPDTPLADALRAAGLVDYEPE
ncbi:MAG: bifunctional diaminohydroxyphosphoribosylaminopyrimidine deaminase/5-amino-6-(5-phosphoribosylamino)uracil reductase RibD [Maricaulaceae bacterium]|jgi:diaminohydroxyphosphoribosylaminopyrimidine deaminase/5-amino-6-(5-phosphoribosylamino)uracil reductase